MGSSDGSGKRPLSLGTAALRGALQASSCAAEMRLYSDELTPRVAGAPGEVSYKVWVAEHPEMGRDAFTEYLDAVMPLEEDRFAAAVKKALSSFIVLACLLTFCGWGRCGNARGGPSHLQPMPPR